ncbi:DNA-binding response regulator [Cupriavidus necator]|uniref:DNA-binding response regulator n=1 Tax=Cupriavidus necator TaxID=106590 RepID=A0A1U9UWH3_CUPNE|nr:response regulator transcription factor [Cupriavidus necator]AQV97020.1 DNA-binding response regulator [Cupriavidus necator]
MSRFPVPTRVALADDHAIVLEGLKQVLSGVGNLVLAGEAADGAQLLRLLEREPADLLVMDLGMPGIDGLAFVQRLRARHPALRILVLTGSAGAGMAHAAIQAGANGYLVKSGDISELVPALMALHEGRNFIAARDPAAVAATTDPLASLTRREQQILMLIARGATAGAIAAQLDISPLTARKHRENLMRKLDLHNTAEVVAYAARQGIPLD